MSGLLPTNFMHWQGKSVPSEELAFVCPPNTFINRQRDRTQSADEDSVANLYARPILLGLLCPIGA